MWAVAGDIQEVMRTYSGDIYPHLGETELEERLGKGKARKVEEKAFCCCH